MGFKYVYATVLYILMMAAPALDPELIVPEPKFQLKLNFESDPWYTLLNDTLYTVVQYEFNSSTVQIRHAYKSCLVSGAQTRRSLRVNGRY